MDRSVKKKSGTRATRELAQTGGKGPKCTYQKPRKTSRCMESAGRIIDLGSGVCYFQALPGTMLQKVLVISSKNVRSPESSLGKGPCIAAKPIQKCVYNCISV